VVPVADADAVLQDLRHALRTGRHGNIGLLAHTTGLVMSPETLQEVEDGIDRVAGHRPAVDQQRMRELWGTYKDCVEVHEPIEQGVEYEHRRLLRARDPKDLPVLAAAASRPNAIILTNDADLIELGLAPGSWLVTTRILLAIAAVDSTFQGSMAAACLGLAGLGAVVRSAIGGSTGARVTTVALGLGLTYVVANAERRARTAAGVKRVIDAASELAAEQQGNLSQLRPFIVANVVAQGLTRTSCQAIRSNSIQPTESSNAFS
jgi:hypothetical protein